MPKYIILLAIVSGTMVLYLYMLMSKKGDKIPKDLPRNLVEVMETIAKEGGRITQSELREKLHYSEAKMSLMLSDLEKRGLIKKIKKGRKNIIIKIKTIK